MDTPQEAETFSRSQVSAYKAEFLNHAEKLAARESHRGFRETEGWKYVLKCLDSVEKGDPEEVETTTVNKLRAFCYLANKREIFARVVELVERLRAGKAAHMPLFGLPVSVKDNIALSGRPLTNGTKFGNYKPAFNGTSVGKLLEAGVVVVGKTKLNGYGLGTNTVDVVSPRGEKYIVGGSSGGPGASVGGNAVTCAVGTDTGGSVRLPAAFCECVGYRPSFGAISRFGVCELSGNFDTVGFLTNTVYQVAQLACLTVGYDVRDMHSKYEANALRDKIREVAKRMDAQGGPADTERLINSAELADKPLDGLTFGMFDTEEIHALGYVDAENRANMKHVERELVAMGARIKRLPILPFETYTAVYYLWTSKQVATNLRRYNKHAFTLSNEYTIEKLLDNLEKRIKERFLLGEYISRTCVDTEKLLNDEKASIVRWAEENGLFDEVEFIITPTGSKVLPERTLEYDSKNMYLLDLFLTMAPILGVCALTLPLRNADRPNCLHITGGYLQDHRLLEVAYAIEQKLARRQATRLTD